MGLNQRGSTLILYAIVGLAVVGTLTGIAAGLYAKGKEAGRAEVRLAWDQANADARAREAKKADTAAVKLEATRVEYRTRYKTITQAVDKIVDRVEYRNVCLDDDGLRLANCAIRGQSADSCKPDKPVPPSPPADGRTGRNTLALDYGRSGAVFGLRGEAPGAD